MRTDFLFAMPSWLSGAARSLDLAGLFDDYNESPSDEVADSKAMFCDWRIVGDTIIDALKQFRIEPPQSSEP